MTRATRRCVELLADLGDHVSLSLLALLVLVGAVAFGALWYTWPEWLPNRWLRRRRRDKPDHDEHDEVEDASPAAAEESDPESEELPDLPVAVFLSLADQLAAERRYAEAIRERLRAIVRDLVDHGVVGNSPGWTVTELARAAADARPAVRAPVDEAGTIFSDIWYGMSPATLGHDDRMRILTAAVHELLDRDGPGPGPRPSDQSGSGHGVPGGGGPGQMAAIGGGYQP